MNGFMEREKEREMKLKSAKIEDGFYNIIGGQRSAAARKLSVINPATGKELATVPDIVAASLDDAVDAARKAFPGWHALPLARRKEILSEVLTEIDRHAEELSVLLTAEQGRPLLQARWEIDLLTKLYGPAFMQMEVVFQKWRWSFLYRPSKGIAVDKQADNDVVHLCRFRKADGLADQALNTCP